MIEIDHFVNPGYGWLCKHCSAGPADRVGEREGRARFFGEGEAEEKEPRLSTPALARWSNAAHQILVCPRCGIEEPVNKA